MNLTDYLPHIAAALGTGAATATVDHLIAKAESLIPNSLWQLIKHLITKQPVRASQEPAKADPGGLNMLDLTKFENFVTQFEHLTGRMVTAAAKATETLAPLAEAAAPFAGSSAPAITAAAKIAEAAAPVAEVLGNSMTEQKTDTLVP